MLQNSDYVLFPASVLTLDNSDGDNQIQCHDQSRWQ